MKRRHFCTTLASAALVTTGHAADLEDAPLDNAMGKLMAKYQLPGGALGMARGGKILYAKGFGFADVAKGEAVKKDTLFRIASISKPFTAAAVLRLVEDGKLHLTDRPFPILGLKPLQGVADPRLTTITVQHLLQHTGGWEKSAADPMFQSRVVCAAAGHPGPADVTTTIRYTMGRRLDFDPGTRYSYSNFGYCVLGALIEKVTGKSYESVVRSEVLHPAGIRRMELANTFQRHPGETSYYDDRTPAPSAFPSHPGLVPWPYGVFSLETNAANGGWTASVEDLLRFAISLDESRSRPLLKPGTMNLLTAPPSHLRRSAPTSYYGLGWQVRPQGQSGHPNLWHVGSLPGTLSLLVRLGDGFDWTVIFNKRPVDWEGAALDVQRTLHKAAQVAGI